MPAESEAGLTMSSILPSHPAALRGMTGAGAGANAPLVDTMRGAMPLSDMSSCHRRYSHYCAITE